MRHERIGDLLLKFSRNFQELDRHLRDHDEQIQAIFSAIRQLMAQPEPVRKKIGFHVREKHSRYIAKPANKSG
jgi:hypothetical protein